MAYEPVWPENGPAGEPWEAGMTQPNDAKLVERPRSQPGRAPKPGQTGNMNTVTVLNVETCWDGSGSS